MRPKALLALVLCVMALCTTSTNGDGDGSVVGFWNIYAQGRHFSAIIAEQKRVIESSGLLQRIDKMYYTTMGEDRKMLQLTGGKFEHLRDFGTNGSEIDTLHELHTFCQGSPNSKVLYFHNKGSLNFNTLNTNFRRALDCFILNPQCLDALNSGYDTCGWRLSPLPHVHYSGNYWWATCKHINKLIPPTIHLYNQTFLQVTGTLYARNKRTTERPSKTNPFPDQPYLGLGRYFAETWMTSAPMFKPSDCMNASTNNRYMWGKYPLPWRMVNKRCPNYKEDFMQSTHKYATTSVDRAHSTHDASEVSYPTQYLTYGLPCSLGGFIAQPRLVKQRFTLSSANFTPELYDRSMLWYGQPPTLHLAWLKIYDTV